MPYNIYLKFIRSAYSVSEMVSGFSGIPFRPVSDLRNKFPEIENLVNEDQPVYLTKNGYGAMVVLSLEQYSNLTDDIEMKLDEADRQAASTTGRLSHQTVFANARRAVHAK